MNFAEQPLSQPAESDGTKYKPVAFALISLLVVFFLYQIVGGGIVLYLFGNFTVGKETLPLQLAMMLAEILFILIPTFFLAKLQTKTWGRFLRLRKTDLYYIGLAVIGVIALQQLLEIYLYLQDLIPLPHQIKHLIDQFQKTIEETYKVLLTARSPVEFSFVVLAVAVTPAICEETLFRGLVQSNFELKMSKTKAIIWTGVIFGAYHLNPFDFVALCVLGIYLSYLVSVSGSIIVPVVAHFTNNFVSTLILYKFNKESVIAPADQKLGAGYIIAWSLVLFLIFVATTTSMVNYSKSRSLPGENGSGGSG
ncbi:MAG TPA: type II CAAX endopeptidase family protein [Candidatus Acidoferrales bacterium]|nr:type II CAAX endopeptidase family protein [Candidatus Acidoferrales bacterium]